MNQMFKSDDHDATSSRNGFDYLKATLSASLSPESRARIDGLVHEVSTLKDIEKLLFCLLLPVDGPTGTNVFGGSSLGLHPEDIDLHSHGFELNSLGVGLFSPGGPSALHLSNQVEQSQAYTWIMSHLEEDCSTCLRKDEVYEDYRAYCDKHHMKTLNTADFGKVMKRAFPNVKPRRLGQRGQSRYCYGGMRKKTEVQPPFLPDLTDEALGLTLQRFTASPASSSGTSGDTTTQKRHHSASPLIRLLQSNGPESDATGWAEEATVRMALGARGSVVSDVAQILLEYAQQVFGAPFQSLFHLAQHLVMNRYVNARSRHAFSLIAHAANAPPSSPPPSAALAEVIQKGLSKCVFDGVGSGRPKSDSIDRSSVKLEDSSRTPTRYNTSENDPPLPPSTPTTHPQSSHTSRSPGASNSARNFTDLCAGQLPTASTPQTYRPYTSNISPLSNQMNSVGTNIHDAVTLAAQVSPQATSPYLLQAGRLTASGIKHPSSAAVALAAAAAAAVAVRHQSSLPNQYATSTSASIYSSSPIVHMSPGPVGSPFDVTTPPVAHEKTTNYSSSTTSASAASDGGYTHRANYLSPASNSSLYVAHQQSSPYSNLQQPPAPLPPGVGARSPYTPTANPSTGVSDTSQGGGKRSTLPHPVEAPGAYEPSPRFHLGGQSPNKRARYMSTTSASSGTPDCLSLGSGSVSDGAEPFGESSVSMQTSVASASPASSGSSNRSAQHSLSVGYTIRSDHHSLGVGDHSTVNLASPYYSSRYEGLEMRSPAPHQTNSGHQLDRIPRLPNMTPAPLDSSIWTNSCLSLNGGTISVSGQSPYNAPITISTSSSGNVFRPPITPFALELEDDDNLTNLPRLGTSPGPQIPPSSPTEFLPFYSEAASKSAKAKRQQCVPQASVDGEDCSSASSTDSPNVLMPIDCMELRNFTPDANLETPPCTILMLHSNGICTEGLVSPDSSSNSSDSRDRTLTNFDDFTGLNTAMPAGLAIASSPSDSTQSNSLIRQREELQNELSTPGPAETVRSPVVNHESSVNPSPRAGSADVSITAF